MPRNFIEERRVWSGASGSSASAAAARSARRRRPRSAAGQAQVGVVRGGGAAWLRHGRRRGRACARGRRHRAAGLARHLGAPQVQITPVHRPRRARPHVSEQGLGSVTDRLGRPLLPASLYVSDRQSVRGHSMRWLRSRAPQGPARDSSNQRNRSSFRFSVARCRGEPAPSLEWLVAQPLTPNELASRVIPFIHRFPDTRI